MAIQNRRGSYVDFVPSRLVPGEFAVVQSNDPNASDGKALYLCISSGVVKRIATTDDIRDILYANLQDLSDELRENLEDLAERAEDAATTAESTISGTVRYDTVQSKTAEEKARARQNIGTVIDTTLTQQGQVADAKSVGDAIEEINDKLDDTNKEYLYNNLLSSGIKSGRDSYTYNGITWTKSNKDLSISAVGTATGNINYYCLLDFVPDKDMTVLLSGCPSGGSSSSYHILIGEYSEGGEGTTRWSAKVMDTGNGAKYKLYKNKKYMVSCRIISGATVDVTFKPSLKNVNDISNVDIAQKVVGENTFLFLKSPRESASYGQCTAIIGESVGLIDIGSDQNCTSIINALKSYSVTSIDFVVLSHYHTDHITLNITNAFDKLSNSFDMTNVTIYLPHKGIDWTRFGDVSENKSAVEQTAINYIVNKGWSYIQPNNSNEVYLNDNLSLHFYNIGDYEDYYSYKLNEGQMPFVKDGIEQINYNSFSMIVEAVSYGKHIVIPGDATFIALDKCADYIKGCDIYVIEHHGLERKPSQKWLSKITPKLCVIFNYSSNYDNEFFKNIKSVYSLSLISTIFNTLNGDVTVKISEGGIKVEGIIPDVDYKACAFENNGNVDTIIDTYLSVYPNDATDIISDRNQYVTMSGKFIERNEWVYFRAVNYYKRDIVTGSGTVSIASNLPAPEDTSIRFMEKDEFGNPAYTNVYYQSVWRTNGHGTQGTYRLVRGKYKKAIE